MLQRLWQWVGQWFRPCRFSAYRYWRRMLAPDLAAWLASNPSVAAAIQWQHQVADPANVYTPPSAAHKRAWARWSASEKAELDDVYREAYVWLECGAGQLPIDPNGVTDRPANQANNVANNQNRAHVQVTHAYMWKLYLAHVAFTLAAERMSLFPWSITSYSAHALRYLLDSTAMAWRAPGFYWMGTPASRVPASRADNLPATAFGPPTWIYPWLRDTGIIGATTRETITRLLQWMRSNVLHFFGTADFGTVDAIWQYRGYPPVSRVIGGTLDPNNPSWGVRCWTAGCHGTLGFLSAVLRAANIPVQPVWICEHEAAHFITDDVYLDHGDDPYNLNVTNSPSPIDSLLIDRTTYMSWFTPDLAVNITAAAKTACSNIGRSARDFV